MIKEGSNNNLMVKDLATTDDWDWSLFITLFDETYNFLISRLRSPSSTMDDNIIWTSNRLGNFSVKSTYSLLVKET